MGCRLRLLFTLAVLIACAWGVANAGVPDPALSTVPKVLTSPGHPSPALDYVVTIVELMGRSTRLSFSWSFRPKPPI